MAGGRVRILKFFGPCLWHDKMHPRAALPHYHTIPHIDTLKIYSCGKHGGKRRNCLEQAISPFLTMFSTPSGTYFLFQMLFKMLSAICLNLDESKILSYGNGF